VQRANILVAKFRKNQRHISLEKHRIRQIHIHEKTPIRTRQVQNGSWKQACSGKKEEKEERKNYTHESTGGDFLVALKKKEQGKLIS